MTPSLPSSSYCIGGFWPVHGGNSGGVLSLGEGVRCVAADRISWLVKALDQGEPEVSRDGAGGDEATHVTIKFERAANSNFIGSRSPATARSRIIFAISIVLAGVRMDDGSDAIAWSKTRPRSDSSSGSNTTPWGDDIDATSPSMCAGHFENPTAVCSGPGRKRTPKRRAVLIKALGLGPAANSR